MSRTALGALARLAPLALVALLVAACSSKGERVGTGGPVGFCRGWIEWDGLTAPAVIDRTEADRWAQAGLRIIDRIDLRVEIDDAKPAAKVGDDLALVEAALGSYRDDLRAAPDDDAARRAAATLSGGPFDRATGDLTTVSAEQCTPEDRRR